MSCNDIHKLKEDFTHFKNNELLFTAEERVSKLNTLKKAINKIIVDPKSCQACKGEITTLLSVLSVLSLN